MPHDIKEMAYVGQEPWHGLGTPLPTNADYESIVEAAGFYKAEERPVFAPGMDEPIRDKKALFREDTGEYLSTVSKGYEVVQFDDVARTLVEAGGACAAYSTQQERSAAAASVGGSWGSSPSRCAFAGTRASSSATGLEKNNLAICS